MNQLRGKVMPCKVPRPVVNRYERIYKPHSLSTASQNGPTFTGIHFTRTSLQVYKSKGFELSVTTTLTSDTRSQGSTIGGDRPAKTERSP